MGTTELLGSLGAGVICLLGTTACGLPLVPAIMFSAIVTAGLIGTCRRIHRESSG